MNANVAASLARIDERDASIGAWSYVDRAPQVPATGPLQGICVGVKDVLDVTGMPTRHGSVLYGGQAAGRDSACVAALRSHGAVLLGKTRCTEFASPVAVGVRNPRDATRTAGVSSSGSAAAVADRMVPLALGTQTGGSIIRPASYCGVVGIKPSIDAIDRTAIRHVRPSLDTIGLFAATLDAGWRAFAALSGADADGAPVAPARIGVCRTSEWDHARVETRAAIDIVAAAAREHGVDVVDVDLPAPFADALDAFGVLVTVETVVAMADDYMRGRATMNAWLRETERAAGTLSLADYRRALATAAACRDALSPIFDRCDVLLTPATAGEAPARLHGLDDPWFCPLWTMMHGPALTFPVHEGPHGMPVGVQVVGRRGDDLRVLRIARSLDDAVRFLRGRRESSP
jgi:Asp-tRNA(Asn)/Glu-tRNA(Gln) amidotransferase A subunit family amidase